jgi:uncharacterized protein YcbX
VISTASLADLNSRLPRPLPMNRFRPNVVVEGLPAYGETGGRLATDRVACNSSGARAARSRRRPAAGTVEGDEPLLTLRTYRWNKQLRGIAFGQNAIVARRAKGDAPYRRFLRRHPPSGAAAGRR